MKKVVISEEQILSEIQKVLNENRKVIKLPNQNPQPAPMPQAPMPQANTQMPMDPADSSAMGGDPGADAMGGNMPMDGGEQSEFDTNFDAGVEADEDSDPKHYIQQLTGKLSQSINSFNSEQSDPGLSKYVASMIIAATCKNLDDKQKKELIDKINGAQNDEPSDDMDDNGMDGSENGENLEDNIPVDNGDVEQTPMPTNEMVMTKKDLLNAVNGSSEKQKPLNERFLTRKELTEMFPIDGDEKPLDIEKNKKCPKAWQSKYK